MIWDIRICLELRISDLEFHPKGCFFDIIKIIFLSTELWPIKKLELLR